MKSPDIRYVTRVINKKEVRPAFPGVLCRANDGHGAIVATDGFRLAYMPVDACGTIDILVAPADVATTLVGQDTPTVKDYSGIDARFPDFTHLIPNRDDAKTIVELPAGMAAALKAIKATMIAAEGAYRQTNNGRRRLPDTMNRAVRIVVADGAITLSSYCTEPETLPAVTIEVGKTTSDDRIAVNIDYALDALSGNRPTTLELYGRSSAMVFRQGDRFHLVMPLFVNWES